MNLSRFRTVVFFTVLYTLLVILWGAWVRISHSGDGCGDTWPLCQGQLIPTAEQGKTWIEYAHRLMSGIYGILIFMIFFWSRKFFPRGHRARGYGMWLLIFCIIEALLGAKLVLFGLVGSNDSFYRAIMMGVHQINSLFLSGTAALLLMTSSETHQRPPLVFPFQAKIKYVLFLILAMTGAWAALSATLFPSASLAEGLAADFAPTGPLITKLRLLHPILALIIGVSMCSWFYKHVATTTGFIKQAYLQTSFLWAFALIFGIMTLLLLSPVWMKISHLLLAHVLWISLVRIFYLRDQIN